MEGFHTGLSKHNAKMSKTVGYSNRVITDYSYSNRLLNSADYNHRFLFGLLCWMETWSSYVNVAPYLYKTNIWFIVMIARDLMC